MDHRRGRRNGEDHNSYLNGRITLLAIMIGFCILAIIEIAFGQARLKTEKERLAMEERNYQAMQAAELEKDAVSEPEPEQTPEEPRTEAAQDNTITNTNYVPEQSTDTQVVDTTNNTVDGTADGADPAVQTAEDDTKEYDMQLVFLGDSILDNTREYDGVATLIAGACNARVYNLSIGGTTAAMKQTDQYDFNNWNSSSLLGVVNAIIGNIDKSFFKDYKAGQVMNTCDFSQTDYFIIEYGVNDFLAQVPVSKYLEGGGELNVQNYHTYAGALDIAVTLLHDTYPNAKILVIAPHYCQIFSGETFIGDGYSLDYGYGALIDYARVCGYVAEQHKEDGVMFYNAFEESGINAYTADQCLEDGIHLTAEGRRKYAEYAARLILADFNREE